MELLKDLESLSPRYVPTEAIEACKSGNLMLLEDLILSNSVINYKAFCRWSIKYGFYEKVDSKDVIVHRELVRIASLNGHEHVVRYLLALGTLGSKSDPVVRAIELGCGEALQLLIEQDSSIVNRMRYSSKFYGDTYQGVCFKGLPQWKNRLALYILYSNSADPNLESDCMCSAIRTGDPEVVELVRSFGCNDDARWYLELAASSGLTKVVQYLLDLGADIDASYPAPSYTWTALHGAAFMGDMEMVEFLLKNGANPQILSESRLRGRPSVRLTPAQVARGPSVDDIRRLLAEATSSPSLSPDFSAPSTPRAGAIQDTDIKGKLMPALSPLIEIEDLDLNEV